MTTPCRCGLLPWLLALLLMATPALAADRLGLNDKVKVTVSEWLPSKLTYRDWSSVTGVYAVGGDGAIAVPYVGAIQALGRSTDDLRADVVARLARLFPELGPRDVTISVAEYAGIYVIGDVRAPGPYPYVPGLTAVQAAALAGGPRVDASSADRAVLDAINAAGQIQLLAQRRARLVAQHARLAVEEEGGAELEDLTQLRSAGVTQAIIDTERKLLAANNDTFEAALAAQREAADLADAQIKSLEDKQATLQAMIEARTADLNKVRTLVDQGLSINTRIQGLEQVLSDLQIRLIDLDAQSFAASESRATALRGLDDARNTRAARLASELHDVETQLSETDAALQTNRSLFAQATSGTGTDGVVATTYTVTRRQGGAVVELPVDRTTALQPGDVLQLALELGAPSVR